MKIEQFRARGLYAPILLFFTMIRSSFIFLDKVGIKKERHFWEQGIKDWNDFLGNKVKGISSLKKEKHDRLIRLARTNLDYGNSRFFNEILPQGEMWRIYPEFIEQAAFVDIETSGYGITVVGVYDRHEAKHFIKGFNLNTNNLLRELYKYKLLITFNGSSFDLPMLRKYTGNLLKIAHIDLRHVCGKLGLTGGLKSIEKQMGINRPIEVQSMLGNDAVYCWEIWKHTNERKYLDMLISYNTEDIVNLEPIAEKCIKELWEKVKNA